MGAGDQRTFAQHLADLVSHPITIKVVGAEVELLSGTLTAVHTDYITLTVNYVTYSMRLDTIVWMRPDRLLPDPSASGTRVPAKTQRAEVPLPEGHQDA